MAEDGGVLGAGGFLIGVAKTRAQGPLFSTMTISLPGEISAIFEEVLSGPT